MHWPRRVGARIFVILAIAPEAQVDRRGFEGAIRDAKQRLEDLQASRDTRKR